MPWSVGNDVIIYNFQIQFLKYISQSTVTGVSIQYCQVALLLLRFLGISPLVKFNKSTSLTYMGWIKGRVRWISVYVGRGPRFPLLRVKYLFTKSRRDHTHLLEILKNILSNSLQNIFASWLSAGNEWWADITF